MGVERNVGEKSTRWKFAEFVTFFGFLFVWAFWTMVQVSFRSGLPPGPWARILPGSTESRKRFRIEFSKRFLPSKYQNQSTFKKVFLNLSSVGRSNPNLSFALNPKIRFQISHQNFPKHRLLWQNFVSHLTLCSKISSKFFFNRWWIWLLCPSCSGFRKGLRSRRGGDGLRPWWKT